MKAEALGSFEQVVLTAVLSLGDEAYGVSIHREAEGLVGRPILLGAVYVTLDRMEAKGFVISRLSAPRAERGGKAKRCYRLRPRGERALRDAAGALKRIADALGRAWS